MRARLSPQIQVGILLLLLSLFGCRTRVAQLRPQYSLPTNSTRILQDLTTTNLRRIGEIGILSDAAIAERVIVMAQLGSEDKLTAVYNDGNIKLWDLQAKNVVLEYNVGFVSTEATSFSADGLSLITPNKILSASTESEYEMTTVIDGINLWDTRTGVQVGCFGFHCQPQREQYNSVTIGAILSPKGDWLVKYAQSALYIVNTSGQKPNVILNLYDPYSNIEQHISKVSFDRSGEYYAIAYEEGNVIVYEFESAIDNNSWIEMLSMGKVQELRRPVRSIKIDPTRTWLALLYENELQIWDLRNVKKNPSISLTIPSLNTITFDQSGNLLVVGAKSGLRLIDLQQMGKVTQVDNDEVSTVFITTDNRLLVWSDTKGIIHLWGVTVP